MHYHEYIIKLKHSQNESLLKNYEFFINEKMGINKDVSDLSDLAFNEIKKNPNREKHVVTNGTYTIVITLVDAIGGSYFNALQTAKERDKLQITIGAYKDSDIKLHTLLIHEINHAIEWANMNKNTTTANLKILNDPYKRIKSNQYNQANSPFHYLIYILGDHEMKSKIHELYLLLKKEIGNRKLSNEELKNILNDKLIMIRPVNVNFLKSQINKMYSLLPDDFNEDTTIIIKDKEVKIGKEISDFLQKEKISKEDLKYLDKFFNTQLSKLRKNVNKLLSHFM